MSGVEYSRNYLKSLFQRGDEYQESSFAALIDGLVTLKEHLALEENVRSAQLNISNLSASIQTVSNSLSSLTDRVDGEEERVNGLLELLQLLQAEIALVDSQRLALSQDVEANRYDIERFNVDALWTDSKDVQVGTVMTFRAPYSFVVDDVRASLSNSGTNATRLSIYVNGTKKATVSITGGARSTGINNGIQTFKCCMEDEITVVVEEAGDTAENLRVTLAGRKGTTRIVRVLVPVTWPITWPMNFYKNTFVEMSEGDDSLEEVDLDNPNQYTCGGGADIGELTDLINQIIAETLGTAEDFAEAVNLAGTAEDEDLETDFEVQGFEFDVGTWNVLTAIVPFGDIDMAIPGLDVDPGSMDVAGSQYAGDLQIHDSVQTPLEWTPVGLASATEINITVRGCYVHRLRDTSENYLSYHDAIGYTLWSNGYELNSVENFHDDPADYTVSDGQRTPDYHARWWRNAAGVVAWDDTYFSNHYRYVWFNPSNNTMDVDNRHCVLAVKFNDNIGFIPLALIPYLNSGKVWSDSNFLKPGFYSMENWIPRTVGHMLSNHFTKYSGDAGTEAWHFGELDALHAAYSDNPLFYPLPLAQRDYNPYDFTIEMSNIEAVFGETSATRSSGIQIAMVSSGLTAGGASSVVEGTDAGVGGNSQLTIEGRFSVDMEIVS
jgi:hypothetical protein